jgi:hypothetical protein
MERDDLDRFMTDDEIVPSSGFTARVMDGVRMEAATPPAIPFPWSRALPGIVAVAVAIVAVIASFFTGGSSGIEAPAPSLATALSSTGGSETAWVVVVLLLSTVPVVLSLRITRGHP